MRFNKKDRLLYSKNKKLKIKKKKLINKILK